MDDRRDGKPALANQTPRGPGRGEGARGESDTLRIVLIALGVVLLVASLPLLFMSGMMGMMMGGAGGGTGFMGVLALLVLVGGVVALVSGVRLR